MSKKISFSVRVLLILETFLVALLAVVVVIYAQVLFQQYTESKTVVTVPEVVQEESEEAVEAPVILTDEEKTKILDSLTVSEEEPLPAEQRQEIIESLEQQPPVTMSDEEKAQVLEALSSQN